MSEDPIRKYLDAKNELDKALSTVEGLKSIIGEVAKALNKPYSFMVSNVNVGFPAEVAMAGGIPTLNADEWPSAKQIAETLAALHKEHHQVRNLWFSLSETDRKNLAPPPDPM